MASFDDKDTDRGAHKSKKQKTGGFRWKDKRSTDLDERKERGNEGLQRGYRDRSPRRDSYRDRSPRRDTYNDRERSPRRSDYSARDRDREPKRRNDDYGREQEPGRDRYRAGDQIESRDDRRGSEKALEDLDGEVRRTGAGDSQRAATNDALSQSAEDKFGLPSGETDRKSKSKKPPKAAVSSQPMIVVNINDRLGTKAAIPCFASDSVKAFKAIVAAHIGRQPHEIMLKRQGERPFKDQLTLEDYGVSSGVQLDLEIDTGD